MSLNRVSLILIAGMIQWAFLGTVPSTSVAADISGTAKVVDGDTIDVGTTRVRLWGIDAPESKQMCNRSGSEWACGREAAVALSDWIGQKPVRCEERARDRYGRTVALCFADGEDVSAWMVSHGYAVAFRKYSTDYVALEQVAHDQKRGVWSSKFEMPWDWRAAR